MADTFKKITDTSIPNDASEDSWKNITVKKEHQPPQPPQPEKVVSTMTYRSLEQQVEGIDNNITSLTNQKTAMEAEMIEVKTAAEAE